MIRILIYILKRLLVLSLALYIGDWTVYRVRVYRGNAIGSVQVSQYLATPLKGNKEEYDYLGQVDQPCARSLFPHAGNSPCWWVERHKDHWE